MQMSCKIYLYIPNKRGGFGCLGAGGVMKNHKVKIRPSHPPVPHHSVESIASRNIVRPIKYNTLTPLQA